MDLSELIDGQTLKGYIAPSELWTEFDFSYRKTTFAEKQIHRHRWDLLSAEEQTKKIEKLLVAKLVEWNVVNKGDAVPLSVPLLMSKFEPLLIARLVSIILGTDISDPRPDAKPAELEENAKDSFRG